MIGVTSRSDAIPDILLKCVVSVLLAFFAAAMCREIKDPLSHMGNNSVGFEQKLKRFSDKMDDLAVLAFH